MSLGSYPFGAPLRRVVQEDRSPKRVFVLGVYASAVHARWLGPDGRQLVRALAVASEPAIFWTGDGAAEIVSGIEVPPSAGRLVPAEQSNGPSGRALDADFLGPLGVARQDAWLCDLVPHTCLNADQKKAVAEKYVPRLGLGLPPVNLPDVPSSFADDERREEIHEELRISGAEIVVLLGDQPIRWWLSHFDSRWRALSDFGRTAAEYGRLHRSTIAARRVRILPVAHPRQVAGLGWHSPEWRALHASWRENVAPELLGV